MILKKEAKQFVQNAVKETIKELLDRVHKPTATHVCSICRKKIEVPSLTNEERYAMKPCCPSWAVFVVQFLIHEGWHIRNLGVDDKHPYFCPDCWTEGTPEFSRRDYCDDWYKQSQEFLNDKLKTK